MNLNGKSPRLVAFRRGTYSRLISPVVGEPGGSVVRRSGQRERPALRGPAGDQRGNVGRERVCVGDWLGHGGDSLYTVSLRQLRQAIGRGPCRALSSESVVYRV